jgi:DNA-binding response OmpR family regulator
MAKRVFLIVEDSEEDAFFIRRAFIDSACEAFVCRNTSEARAYVLGAGMYQNRTKFPFPEVVISDLRLGAESGINFLKWFRSQKTLNAVPFILLSGAATAQDMELAKKIGATKVVVKPGDSTAFHDLIVKLLREFCRTTHMPQRRNKGAVKV